MNTSQFKTIFCVPKISLLILSFIFLTGCSEKENSFTERQTEKSVVQIAEDAEFAITERNFRVNISIHIGKAIAEREQGGFPDNEVILFCNLSYAKRMLELAPEFISYCPQRLTIRDTGTIRIITASLLPTKTSNSALNTVTREINNQVQEIVAFAAEEWPPLEE